LVLERVSVSLVVVCLGLSVTILVVVWRVWGTTDRVEQDGKERLEHLREERRVLLEQLVGLREQKERLQWLREGRAEVTAAGIRYMGFGRGYGLSPARTHEEVEAS
jgi:hypothetical protein